MLRKIISVPLALCLFLCILCGCGSTTKRIYDGAADKVESATIYRISGSGYREKKEVTNKEDAVQIASDLLNLTYEAQESDDTVYMGAFLLGIQLHYEDGTSDWLSFCVIGQGDVMYIPAPGERYHFTWHEADTLFADLDYPALSSTVDEWLGPTLLNK